MNRIRSFSLIYSVSFVFCIIFLISCSSSPKNSFTSVPASFRRSAHSAISIVPKPQINLGPWASQGSSLKPSKNEHFKPVQDSDSSIIHLIFKDRASFKEELAEFKIWIANQDFKLIKEKTLRKRVPKKILLKFQKDKTVYSFIIKQKIKGKTAIVIDDLGHNQRALPILYQIKRPMTLAILPHLAFSKKFSRELHEKGYEILLHLPMENLSGQDPGPGAVTTQMSEEEINQVILDDLESVPQAIGVNNHMGSKATQDERVMSLVLKTLKDQKKFFLDSLTCASVAKKAAEEENQQIHSRDVFLDNENTIAYVEGQLKVLKRKALRRRRTIAIGHFKEKTLQAILDAVPEFEDEGIQFVFLSEFYKN